MVRPGGGTVPQEVQAMSRKRRVLGAALKARVALAAIRGDRITAQLATEFGVHTSQVTAWKKRLLEAAPDLFGDGRSSKKPEGEFMHQC
jgi:transposase-like protein